MRNITNEAVDRISLALCLATTYIAYVEEEYPALHEKADGTPSCQEAVRNANELIATLQSQPS